MKVSAKGRYAVRSVINLSRSTNGQKSVREVAKEEDISSDFLEKIFSKLKKHGIITSVRGAHGGFSLNIPVQEITILSILEAIGEELSPTPCSSDKCGKECDISYFWAMTKEHISQYFERITISDIINREINI
ncbi:MAG: Rrf2 family transcriptional regulator [Spirochaetaceae bacterium]